jgi:transposase
LGTKIHLLCDGNGVPLHFEITAGQVHEASAFEEVMEAVEIPQPRGRPRCRPNKLAGDKAYRIPRILDWLRDHGIQPVIPRKSNEKTKVGRPESFDKEAYQGRNVIERCVGWLKECRRILTRFEKTALNFIGMVQVAFIERYLRILF